MSLREAQSNNWFNLIVEGIPNAILMVDHDGRIILINHNTETLFGYSRTELMDQPLDVLVPPRYRSAHRGEVARFLASPRGRPMGNGLELVGLRKDGREIPVEIGLNPMQTPDGLVTFASIIDVTERRRAEEAEQQMAALVESANDAILIKSLDGIIRSWNPGAARLLGYEAAEIIGQPVTRLIPDDRQHEESRILEQIRGGQRVDNFETVRRHRDGLHIDVSLTISPVRDRSGTIIGASKIMRDITERKRAEAELRHSNAKLGRTNADLDAFVYTASHDLRAPLNGISTVVQWIHADDPTLTPQTEERLALIERRIERMKRLLNDIRDYARTGRIAELSGTPLSAAAVAEEAVAACHVPPGFSIELDPSLASVELYRLPLEQVLRNLINNAIQHHDRATGTVTLSVEVKEGWLRFSVVDDGPGVPEQYRTMIFEMFQTLKPRDEKEASGMGLSMVRKIVSSMGGICGVESAGERGARFWFDWPESGLPLGIEQ